MDCYLRTSGFCQLLAGGSIRRFNRTLVQMAKVSVIGVWGGIDGANTAASAP